MTTGGPPMNLGPNVKSSFNERSPVLSVLARTCLALGCQDGEPAAKVSSSSDEIPDQVLEWNQIFDTAGKLQVLLSKSFRPNGATPCKSFKWEFASSIRSSSTRSLRRIRPTPLANGSGQSFIRQSSMRTMASNDATHQFSFTMRPPTGRRAERRSSLRPTASCVGINQRPFVGISWNITAKRPATYDERS
jgi:hypothetical protein